jgi:hypothetical protein
VNYRVPVQLIERNLSQISKDPGACVGAARGLAAWPVARSTAVPARVERAAAADCLWLSSRSGWVGKTSSMGRADRAREPWIEREAGNERPAGWRASVLAPRVGLEPTTHGLTVRCSTD